MSSFTLDSVVFSLPSPPSLPSLPYDQGFSDLQRLKFPGYVRTMMVIYFLLQLVNRLYPHHLGHYLGMDTHDTMVIDRNTRLAPGMVVTIEPGVYIPQDYHGDSKMAEE